ncbi:MAG: hypothetical protein HY791_08875 [Deltaproteobacteria bacterium]|nr:hypothetical protein [Deltaproteobacteria bacterium]
MHANEVLAYGRSWLALGLAAVLGCSADTSVPSDPEAFRTIDAPVGTREVESDEALGFGDVRRFGRTAEGASIAVGDRVAFVYDGGAWAPRLRYAEHGAEAVEPRAVAPSATTGAYVLSPRSILALGPIYLEDAFELAGGTDLAVAAEGPLEGIWVATATGALVIRDGKVSRYEIGLGGPIDFVAVTRSGSMGLVSSSLEGLVALQMSAGQLSGEASPIEDSTVHDLDAGPYSVLAATSNGVIRRDSSGWTWFVLGPTHELDVDPVTGVAWVRGDDELYSIDGDVVAAVKAPGTELGLATELGPDRMSVDLAGDLFVRAPDGVVRLRTGAGPVATFDEVTSLLRAHCVRCHANQTQDFLDYEVFVTRADEALRRVRSGDMPRCEGGVRCKEPILSPGDWSVLERWIRGGKRP